MNNNLVLLIHMPQLEMSGEGPIGEKVFPQESFEF